jgi:cytochrome P450
MTFPTIDLRDLRFQTEKYALIEELRAAGPAAKTTDGAVVFFNQEDVIHVLKCEDFRFTFNLIDTERSPYLAKAIEHELLKMHGDAHGRVSRLLKMALRDRVFEDIRSKIEAIV